MILKNTLIVSIVVASSILFSGCSNDDEDFQADSKEVAENICEAFFEDDILEALKEQDIEIRSRMTKFGVFKPDETLQKIKTFKEIMAKNKVDCDDLHYYNSFNTTPNPMVASASFDFRGEKKIKKIQPYINVWYRKGVWGLDLTHFTEYYKLERGLRWVENSEKNHDNCKYGLRADAMKKFECKD